ncbi:MAG: GNAT family N-acetyltransferase [Holophaga sp.]|nr:GNAT family N-acetyltransferase [Holophaga sp.]
MTVEIGHNLALIQQPRTPTLGDYDWFDIEQAGTQVGKSRCRIDPEQFTIFSIMIYPEYEGHGYARAVIDHFKQQYPFLIADRVRYTARDFWLKVGFEPESIDRYVWRR